MGPLAQIAPGWVHPALGRTALDLAASALPGDWKNAPAPASTKDFGTALLRKADYGIIRIPSAIMDDEYNYLLNPLFRKAVAYSIRSVRDFIYDVRLKL